MDPAQRISLIGSDDLLTVALKSHIKRETATPCRILSPDSLNKLQRNDLAIINADKISAGLISKILSNIQDNCLCESVAIYQLNDDKNVQTLIKWPIVKGIFHPNDSLDLLVAGIKAITQGNHWFSRRHTDILATLRVPPCRIANSEIDLTEREQDILSLISGGLQNIEIANQLSLSPHTVKTHLYNVYKKLGIKNRSQAARWVQINGIGKAN